MLEGCSLAPGREWETGKSEGGQARQWVKGETKEGLQQAYTRGEESETLLKDLQDKEEE